MMLQRVAFIIFASFMLVLAAISFVGLTGCATPSEPKPVVCDGKHRRPANPYGSVLTDTPAPPVVAAQPKADAPAGPGPQSSIDPRSAEPCGGRA